MDAVLNWLWQGGVVALVVAVMLRLLERARAQVRYVVCWAALLVVLGLPLVPLVRAAVSQMQTVPISAAVGPIVSMPTAWWTSSTVVMAVWALWSSIYGVRLAAAMLALRRAKRRSGPFPTTVEPLLHHWVQISDQGRRADLVVSDRVRAAAVLGCGRPVIAVAPALVQHLDADELDRIVVHEWAHVQRRDDLANLVQLLIRLIAGWHPAVWWIDRRLQIEREIACDEMTIAVTGAPKSYASCLVKLASLPLARFSALPAVGALSSTGLSRRIVRIMSRQDFASPVWSRGAAVVVIAVLCALAPTIGGFRIIQTAVSLSSLDALRTTVQAGAVHPNGLARSRATDEHKPPVAQADTSRPAPSGGPPRTSMSRVDPQPAALTATGTPVAESTDVAVDSAGEASGPTVQVEPVNTPASPSPPIETPVLLDTAPRTQPAAAEALTRSPWNTATDAGVAIGRRSKDVGVATAGFFNRFGRRIAGVF